MTNQEFRKLVEEAIDSLPKKIRKKMENVAVVIEDNPTPSQRRKLRNRGLVFGLYEGVPQPKRSSGYSGIPPDKITIFKDSIEKRFKSDHEIREKVKKTVWHEVAHHFGFNEKEVRELEQKKY